MLRMPSAQTEGGTGAGEQREFQMCSPQGWGPGFSLDLAPPPRASHSPFLSLSTGLLGQDKNRIPSGLLCELPRVRLRTHWLPFCWADGPGVLPGGRAFPAVV